MTPSRSHRLAVAFIALLAMIPTAACNDPVGSTPIEGRVGFTFGGGTGQFSAAGDLVLDQGIPNFDEWAVAADPDSVGGIVITAFQPSTTQGEGDLFILQLRPARTGGFAPCAPNAQCHGRLFRGWKIDLTGFAEWFEIVSGSVDVDQLSESRIRGSFQFTLRDNGGQGTNILTIENGSFDVPVSDAAGQLLCSVPPVAGCTS